MFVVSVLLSGRGLCDELITCPEESYRLWCVVVCDLEKQTSWMRKPRPTRGISRQEKKQIFVCIRSTVNREGCLRRGLWPALMYNSKQKDKWTSVVVTTFWDEIQTWHFLLKTTVMTNCSPELRTTILWWCQIQHVYISGVRIALNNRLQVKLNETCCSDIGGVLQFFEAS